MVGTLPPLAQGSGVDGGSGLCTGMPGSCAMMKGQLFRGLLSSMMGGGPTLGIGNNP